MTHAIPIINDEELRRMHGTEPSGFGCLRTERGLLPLLAMNVDARIIGLAYSVTLEQTFHNALREPMEATYIFPLPDRAGVTRFRMEVNGRVVEGDLKERGEARREYDAAIQAGHRAAITEEERSGTFTMRVGNLMPGERAKVTLSMTGPLVYDDGEATFRFPLVVAPRYIPGNALGGENVGDGTALDTDAVPDASRITPPVLLPGFPNAVRLGLEVTVDGAGLPISDLRSSLHAVVEEPSSGLLSGARRVRVQPGERLNRDFVLRFRLPASNVRTALHLVPDADGREGTFLLTLVPPDSAALGDKPRDVVFILDRSGSMEGWKMVAARRAVARMLDTLRSKDNFAVYAFDDSIETAHDGLALVAATDRNRFRAVEMLAKLESRGGTEMLAPLITAAQTLAGGYHDRDRIIVLATDGQVGNEDQILNQLSAQMRNVRMFSLGIDRAVNEGFLKRLAALGGGLSEIVESEDRLDEVMDKIHRRIGTPVVSEVSIAPTGLEVAQGSIAPSRVPDLFAGAPVLIGGRYRGAAPQGARLSVSGRDAIGRPWSEEVAGAVVADSAITTIWARAFVRELEDRFVIGRGDRRAMEKQIVEASVRFRVLSRFTAFIAVDRSERVNVGGQVAKVTQPVEAPEGWDMFANSVRSGIAGGAMPPPPASAKMRASAFNAMPAVKAAAPSPAQAQGPAGAKMELDDLLFESEKKADAGRARKPPVTHRPMPSRAPLRRAEEAAAPVVSRLDLTPYRERASRLYEQLRQAASADRTQALFALAAALKTLLEDLRSVGADVNAIAELEVLFVELARITPALSEDDIAALTAKSEAALQHFANAQVGASRREFWK